MNKPSKTQINNSSEHSDYHSNSFQSLCTDQQVAEAKSKIEKFDKSQLVFTLKGKLDRRYNVNKAFLSLLTAAGETEENVFRGGGADSFTMFRNRALDQEKVKQEAQSALKNFDVSQLIYTGQGRLDMRYNHNKDYLRLVGLSEDKEKMASIRPKNCVAGLDMVYYN